MNIYRIISLVAAGFMLVAIFTLASSALAQDHGWDFTNSPERCGALATPEEPIEVWSCFQPWGTDSTDVISNDPTYEHNGPYTDVLYIAGNRAHPDYNSGRVTTNRPLRHEGEYLFSISLGGRYWPGWHPDGRHIDVLLEYRLEGEENWQYLWANTELDPNDFEGGAWWLFDFSDRVPAHVNFDWRVSFHDPHEFNHLFRVNASRIERLQANVVSNENGPPGMSLDFTVYPNPTVGRVNFEGLTQPVVVEVYDLMGRRVYRGDEVLSSLNLSGLPSGVYVVGATTRDGASARQRVTVVR